MTDSPSPVPHRRFRWAAIPLLAIVLAACGGSTATSTAAPTPGSSSAPTQSADAQASSAPSDLPAPTTASGFPSNGRVITMIVPWAAGGAADLTARMLVPYLEEDLGLIVQVANQPGAGSQVGLSAFSQMVPDGYAIASTNLPITNVLYLDPRREAIFDATSFAPIANAVSNDIVLAVKGDSEWTALADFVDAAKAAPTELTYGAPGFLSNNQLAALELMDLAGIEISLVQFEGGAPAITALLGGNVDALFALDSDVKPFVESGELKVITVFTESESQFYPGVPTATAEGFAIVQQGTRGFSAPAGTPDDVVDRLALAFERAIATPELQAQMTSAGLTPKYLDPDEYAAFWKSLDETMAPIVKEAVAAQ